MDSSFTARETQDFISSQRQATNNLTCDQASLFFFPPRKIKGRLIAGYKQPSKLSQLQNTQIIYLQRLTSPCLASSYRRWKCKKGKRLTITANFQERNLGTALSGKKIRPVGRIVKSWTGYERVISQSDSRI